MADVFTLTGTVDLDTGKVIAGLQKVGQEAQNTADKSQSMAQKFGAVGDKMASIGSSMMKGITLPVMGAGIAFTKVASDAAEMQSKFDTVFKETSSSVEKWAADYGNAVGRSSDQLKEATSNSADLLIGMGMTETQAGSLSMQMVELALDLGSFNNASDEQSIEAFTKALMGETEMMKGLGVNLSDTIMEQSEFVKKTGKSWKEMTLAEKATARYNEALKQSPNAIGDAVKTADGFANQLKRMKGNLHDLAKNIGNILLPVMTKLVQGMNKAIKALSNFAEKNPEVTQTIVILAGALATVGPVLFIVGKGMGLLAALSASTGFALMPLIGIIAAVGATLTALAVGWSQNLGNIQGVTSSAFATIKATFAESSGKMQEIFKTLWGVCKDIWATVGEPMFNLIGQVVQICVNFFQLMWPKVMEVFKVVVDAIKIAWENVGKPVFEIIKTVAGSVISFIQANWPTISKIIDQVFGIVRSAWENVLKPVFERITSIVKDTILPTFQRVWPSIQNLMQTCFNIAAAAWNGILKPALEGLVSTVQWVWDRVSPVLGWIEDKFSSVFNWIGDKIQWASDKLNSFMGFFRNAQAEAQAADWGIPSGAGNIEDYLYKGTDYWKGGYAMVGEQGPEIVELPRGSKVKTASETQKIQKGTTVNIYSPKALSPSEAAREFEKIQRKLAFNLA